MAADGTRRRVLEMPERGLPACRPVRAIAAPSASEPGGRGSRRGVACACRLPWGSPLSLPLPGRASTEEGITLAEAACSLFFSR